MPKLVVMDRFSGKVGSRTVTDVELAKLNSHIASATNSPWGSLGGKEPRMTKWRAEKMLSKLERTDVYKLIPRVFNSESGKILEFFRKKAERSEEAFFDRDFSNLTLGKNNPKAEKTFKILHARAKRSEDEYLNTTRRVAAIVQRYSDSLGRS